MPKPLAPAARYTAMPEGVIPPTGISITSGGSTARNALTAAGCTISAGNSLSAVAASAQAFADAWTGTMRA